MSTPTLLGLCGSLRQGSFNRKLMHVAAGIHGGPFSEGSIRLPLYDGDLEQNEGVPAEVHTLAEQIAAADGVLICTPEYNQALPGGLKNALDWVSRPKGNPWLNKPVALMSAAAGRAGGARSQFSLRLALVPFRPIVINGPEVLVANASKEFAEDGSLSNEMYLKAITETVALLKAAA
ncbi:MAG: NAD(P)H-dependent oxidoreductase [Rhodobacteraceae bacterium]|nr:NAD(P)H-dependent oxidoreductase [Paracoccaceae bacterium]